MGGRNQEFALALLPVIADLTRSATRDGGAAPAPLVVAASVGTDGIDGPTDAAGAIVDTTTLDRAAAQRLDAPAFLNNNDSYHFFRALDDLIRTGPTGTNVGDLQVALIA